MAIYITKRKTAEYYVPLQTSYPILEAELMLLHITTIYRNLLNDVIEMQSAES